MEAGENSGNPDEDAETGRVEIAEIFHGGADIVGDRGGRETRERKRA